MLSLLPSFVQDNTYKLMTRVAVLSATSTLLLCQVLDGTALMESIVLGGGLKHEEKNN